MPIDISTKSSGRFDDKLADRREDHARATKQRHRRGTVDRRRFALALPSRTEHNDSYPPVTACHRPRKIDDRSARRPLTALDACAQVWPSCSFPRTVSTVPLSARNKRRLVAAAKVLLVVLVAWFVRATLVKAWDQVRHDPWQADFRWLAVSTLLYVVSLLPAAWFFWLTLRKLHQPVDWQTALRAYCVGHLGKYVPGKAMVVVLRAGLVRGPGVSTPLAAAAVFYETLTMMAVGAFWAAAVLAVHWRQGTLELGDRLPAGPVLVGTVAMLVVSLLPTVPPLFVRLLALMKIDRQTPAPQSDGSTALRSACVPHSHDETAPAPRPDASRATEDGPPPSSPPKTDLPNISGNATPAAPIALGYGLPLAGWIAMAVAWLLMGASLWATIRGISAADLPWTTNWPDYSAVMAVALVAGFLSMIPAGFGVRDLLLVVLCARLFHIGEGSAAVATALLRIEWLLAELIVSGILLVYVKRRDPCAADQTAIDCRQDRPNRR